MCLFKWMCFSFEKNMFFKRKCFFKWMSFQMDKFFHGCESFQMDVFFKRKCFFLKEETFLFKKGNVSF